MCAARPQLWRWFPFPPLSAVQDGVVLGADTRSTAGTTVADKNCEKIHYIAPNVYCCGAGTAADTENVTGVRPAREAPAPATSASRAQCCVFVPLLRDP